MLQVILSVLSSTGIISIILHEILVKRKQRKKQDKKWILLWNVLRFMLITTDKTRKLKK